MSIDAAPPPPEHGGTEACVFSQTNATLITPHTLEALRQRLVAFALSWALTVPIVGSMYSKVSCKHDAEEEQLPRYLQLKGQKDIMQKLFILDEQIGSGSFGKVFVCRRTERVAPENTTEQLCIKVVQSEKCSDAQMDLLSLKHDNIVRLRHIILTDDGLYTVMDRCFGLNLESHLTASGGSLSLQSVQHIAKQAVAALEAIHAMSLMHRDLKPENFQFQDERTKTLKLLDFGSAKRTSSLDKQHTVCGTLLYAAPEVFSGAYNQKCDLWSLGSMFFYLMSGKMPFDTSDLLILRSMHRDPVLNGDNLFRGRWWQEVPTAPKKFVQGLLTVDPSARMSAADAKSHALLRSTWKSEQAKSPRDVSEKIPPHPESSSTASPLLASRRSARSVDLHSLASSSRGQIISAHSRSNTA